jgi:hypothetical protein
MLKNLINCTRVRKIVISIDFQGMMNFRTNNGALSIQRYPGDVVSIYAHSVDNNSPSRENSIPTDVF